EPNSNLDAEGEEALTKAILGVRARAGIVLIVAHRPSALVAVDRVLVMMRGAQHAFGPKEEILTPTIRREPAPPAPLKIIPRAAGCHMDRMPTGDERRSLRHHLLAGSIIALLLTVGVGGWAATTELSGAVIAPGSVVVDSNVKKVQHLTGGIVGELLVRDGQRVRGGEIVLRLDETITRTNLAIVRKGLDEMHARRTRLASERDQADDLVFAADLLARAHEPDLAAAIDSERKLFELRRSARLGQKSQLK